MKKEDLKVFKERLLAMRARLRGQYDSMAESALLAGCSGAAADGSGTVLGDGEAYEREFAFDLIANEENLLDQIEAALERIEEGTYGTCLDCNCKISKSRLNAIPYAALCIKCASERERV